MDDVEIASIEETRKLIHATRSSAPVSTSWRWHILIAPVALITAGFVLLQPMARMRRTISSESSAIQSKWMEWPARFNSEIEKCGEIEENVDYQGSDDVEVKGVSVIYDAGSAEMCCAACAGYPTCGAWTWGKRRKTMFLTDVCWLKTLDPGETPLKVPNPNVTSGRPAQGLHKHGVVPPPSSHIEKMEGVVSKEVASTRITKKCPGNIRIAGEKEYSLTSAGVNTPGKPGGRIEAVDGDMVVPHMGGRTYFSESCQDGDYDQTTYAAVNLIGKRLIYTTDVSGTGCGCNAAFYLTSMRQNMKPGKCEDYYCDAMSVCGVACGEIDIQEANQYSFFSTLHTFNQSIGEHGVADSLGLARGYGGSLGEPSRRDWTSAEYGPGARCIDTQQPFQVAVSFPSDGSGYIASMDIELSQDNRPCTLKASNNHYHLKHGRDGLRELSSVLRAGMTPIISYWKSKDMLWMDGLGADGRGPCVKDAPKECPEYVRFYSFSLERL